MMKLTLEQVIKLKPKVFIPKFTSRYKKMINILNEVANVEYFDIEKRKEQLAVADGIIGGRIDEETLKSAPNLKVVARYGVGYDDCDVATMTKYKVYLCHTPNVLNDAVADLAITLLLACNRKIVQADKYSRKGWAENTPPGRPKYGVDLKNKTIGIIGLGRIGYEMAKRCVRGFDMKLIYYDLFQNQLAEKDLGAKKVTLEELMKNSDFISIHVALTPETQGLIGEKELSLMKKTAYIVNTSRGPVIDQIALTNTLKEEAIAGAGLDVFSVEPIPSEDPLLMLENVVLAPHIGSATEEAREGMAVCDAKNISAVLKGEIPPPNVVPEQRGLIFKK
jgi:glyoxylate reductase